MNITNVKTVEQATVVELAGRIDSQTAPEVQRQIFPLIQTGSKIILDMTRVTYMSSAGLRMLAATYQHISDHDGRIVLVGLSERIQDTMSITGFLRYFTICETLPIGLAALQ